MFSTEELLVLAKKIERKLKEEFAELHLSGNLMDTIEIEQTDFGFNIKIPAEIYDLRKWYEEGVIVYTGNGSYAQAVDVEGGFSKKHKRYVEDAIFEAIDEFLSVRWLYDTKNNYAVSKDGRKIGSYAVRRIVKK